MGMRLRYHRRIRSDGPPRSGQCVPAEREARMSHILVPFEGEGSGVAPMSWGQRELWGGMLSQRTWMPLATVLPLPAGTTVQDVVRDLRFTMGRYQSMRTRLRFEPDGSVLQELFSRG